MFEIQILLIVIAVVAIFVLLRSRASHEFYAYCPSCREVVHSQATRCPHCQSTIDPRAVEDHQQASLAGIVAKIIAAAILVPIMIFSMPRGEFGIGLAMLLILIFVFFPQLIFERRPPPRAPHS